MANQQDKAASIHVDSPEHDMTERLKDEPGTIDVVPNAVLPVEQRLSFVQCIRTYKYASLLCVFAAVGALSDGYQVQMSGSIIALPGFINTFGERQPNGKLVLDPQHVALWGSLKNVAAMFGAGIGSYPADKLGRRWMLLVVQIVMCGACVLEQLSTKWEHWLGARLLDGFSIGLAQCCINVYISEMAPTAGRGALMALVQLFYSLGSFLSAISLNIVNQQKASDWRHAVLSQFALSGAAIICWCFLPETPRWHCVKGHEAVSKKIMTKINGKVPGYDVDHEYDRMLVEIENVKVTASLRGGGSYADVFRGVNLRRLFISFLPWHSQVAMGVPIIGTYSSYFFKMAGLSNPFHGTIATNCVSLTMLLVAVPLIERLGRRTLLVWFCPVMFLSLLIIGSVLRTSGPAVGPVLITMACVWSVGHNLSNSPTGYIYVAETATTRIRAKTTGVAIVGIQAMATVYVYIAPVMLNSPKLGMSNTVFFFVGTGVMVYILIWFFVPETKGRTYAELDELFERKIPAWKFAQTEVHVAENSQREQQRLDARDSAV